MGRRAFAVMVAAAVAFTGQGLVGLGGLAGAARPEVNPTLSPPSGQTAVQENDQVTFGGTVSPGSTLVKAELLEHTSEGNIHYRYPTNAKIDSTIPGSPRISGSKVNMGLTRHEGWIVLEVTVENSEGERTTGRSNEIPIDVVSPSFEGAALTGTREIRIDFTEPVRDPELTGGLAFDWLVEGHHLTQGDGQVAVEAVDGAGKARTLGLKAEFEEDEDATPDIRYRPIDQATQVQELRKVYRDGASRKVRGWEIGKARDLVPPSLVPVIESIAGVAGADVVGTDTTPAVELSNLRVDGPAGHHKGRAYLESNDEPGLQASGSNADALLGAAVGNDAGEATIQVEGALPDDEHTIYAVAADRAKCNPNSGSAECPNLTPAESAPAVRYVLDTVAPLPLYAAVEEEFGPGVIKVRFSESLTPDGAAGLWTVRKNGQPTPVTVSAIDTHAEVSAGDTRLLRLEGEEVDLHEAFTVEWTPAVDDAYTDLAGNALAGFSPLEVSFGVPPVLNVTEPNGGSKIVKTTTYTIKGEVTEGLSEDTQIEVFAGADTTTPPVATALAGADGSFSVSVGLGQADGQYLFSVQARRLAQDVASSVQSVSLTLDRTPPEISSLTISDQIVRGGQEAVEINWSPVEDDHLDTVNLFWRAAPGAQRQRIDTNVINDGVHEWRVPENENSENAVIELTATDDADNVSVRFTDPFIIDSIAPTFSAKTVDARHVEVRFSELVSGTTDPSEWFINGLPVDGLDKTILDDLEIIRLTAHESQQIPSNVQADDIRVTYQHLTAPIASRTTRFADRADNQLKMEDFLGEHVPLDQVPIDLPRATEFAADGIAPGAPTLNAVRALVDRGSVPLTGTGDGTPVNQVVVRRVAPSEAVSTSVVHQRGTFDVLAGLAQDSVNVFRVSIEDPAGNRSAVRQVVITEDSSGPAVTVKDRKRRIRAKKKALVAQWGSVEPHPGFSALYLEFRKRSGKTRMLTIADQTVDDGREKARFPKHLRKKMRKGKIKAIRFHVFSFDALGHAGSDTGRWVKVRGKRRRR